MTVKVKILDDEVEGGKFDEGEIVAMADKSAAALVDRGYAEYVDDDADKEESKAGVDTGRGKARDVSGERFSYEIEDDNGTVCFVAQSNLSL